MYVKNYFIIYLPYIYLLNIKIIKLFPPIEIVLQLSNEKSIMHIAA